MANGDVQSNLASNLASEYDRPIAVSVISKLSKFPTLQQLGFAGQIGSTTQQFHGLQDFQDQMTLYSSSHPILEAAWKLIQKRVALNTDVSKNMFTSPSLGTVGKQFQQIAGFNQVFAVDPGDLKTTTAAKIVSSNT